MKEKSRAFGTSIKNSHQISTNFIPFYREKLPISKKRFPSLSNQGLRNGCEIWKMDDCVITERVFHHSLQFGLKFYGQENDSVCSKSTMLFNAL